MSDGQLYEGPLRHRSRSSRMVGWFLMVLFVCPVPVALVGLAAHYLVS